MSQNCPNMYIVCINLRDHDMIRLMFILGRMSFEPSEGKYIAYPDNREIKLLDCESWGQRMSFTHSLVGIYVIVYYVFKNLPIILV